jgi:DNA polymerase III delta prime subunit
MNKQSGLKKKENENVNFLEGHHAYLVLGVDNNADLFLSWLEKHFEVSMKGNPDFLYSKFETLTIDDARAIKEQEDRKSFSRDSKKIFVINANLITVEAQNSFLKMFEEPSDNTKFFIVGACVSNLIPTLLSRLMKVPFGAAPSSEDGAAKAFLALTKAKRLAFVKKLADDIKDEKKSNSEAVTFVNELELYLYDQQKGGRILNEGVLRLIEKSRDYLLDRSASVKMILEFIAIIVP